MIDLVIYQPELGEAVAQLNDGTYIIGSGANSHIQLDYPGVMLRHAKIVVAGARAGVMDLCGKTLDDQNRALPTNKLIELQRGDEFHVGPILLRLGRKNKETGQGTVSNAAAVDTPIALDRQTAAAERAFKAADLATVGRKTLDKFGRQEIPVLRISGVPENLRPFMQELKKQVHGELLKRLNLKKLAVSGAGSQELNNQACTAIREILSELAIKLPPGIELSVLEKELIQEAIGLGPLEYLIELDDITEIMVNGPDKVYVEHKGVLYRTDTAFADANQVLAAIERIVSPLGRRIDESSPMVDARLADGSRVNAVIPPLSLIGPVLTIRKFAKTPLVIGDLIRFGSISQDMADFLRVCVMLRKNIIISGGTGSGKTTLLNVLSAFIPNRERIVTIEDAAELQLNQEHIVRLESRPPNIEGRGEITIRDLVRNALRMRPDRIVVGECRGGEALDMLQAMNTGHDGSLTTIHANSPRDAMSRLETLVLMAGFDLPLRAIREQTASAIDIVVQISRERDGSRKITNISEITKMEGEIITMQDIFIFRNDGWDDNDRIMGEYVATGSVPTFMDEIKRARLQLDIGIFSKIGDAR